jgi:hypothetical protein
MVESFEQVFEHLGLPAEATSTPVSAGIGPLTQRVTAAHGIHRCRAGVGQGGVEVWS